MTPQQSAFLNEYLTTLSQHERSRIPDVVAEYFCADEYNANECARLINAGIKTASCSLKIGYDIDHEPLPQIGRVAVVLNWAQMPICIIKLTDVLICPFDSVTEEFAYQEGEGDRTYDSWRRTHIDFFQRHSSELGHHFTTRDELVLELFEKVYPV
ncbi:RNA-binding protein [Vibrio sp. 10N.286.49.C2]|uniref:ASCH domain-containing protein n=1 Tax=unclassified Vibrio TaxID=2614977 RepID=UPI000C816444|nr:MULTISPECIES: ASCH domain-containing protein [unclassified Vibrio]PMH37255.1 RNA-binding protein [Vibrio sp. 10N.286.49.C2]PMH57400.1 RNA-binding protein [Vibrio sp. 10N.286.49.B1]PMH82159.1 RNA-binding protein [Vibrio sp. 10N.286.48.B7]